MFYGMMASTAIYAEANAEAASREAKSAAMQTRDLEERLDRALLACEALWTFVRDQLGVTDAQFVQRIQEIDLSDGKLDGRVRRPPVDCPSCQRKNSPRFQQCLYCSAPLGTAPFA